MTLEEMKAVEKWINTILRDAVLDDVRVTEKALHLVKVGLDDGDPPVEVMRRAIISFVLDVAGISLNGTPDE